MLFPWVGVHMKCFHLMQRLIEYRKDVMRLTPDNNIFGTEDESTRIPASLGEMYEGYQSRIYWKDGVGKYFRSGLPMWKVEEPYRYYYDNNCHGDTHIKLYSNLQWPWKSPYAVVRRFLFLLSLVLLLLRFCWKWDKRPVLTRNYRLMTGILSSSFPN